MRAGDKVLFGGVRFSVLVEYDDEFVYLDTGANSAQLVAKSELVAA